MSDQGGKLIKNEEQKISNPLENIEVDSQQIAGVLVEATTGSIVSSIPVLNKMFDRSGKFRSWSKNKSLLPRTRINGHGRFKRSSIEIDRNRTRNS